MKVNIRKYIFDIEDDHVSWFWPMVNNNKWETFSLDCIQNNSGKTFWDFGAWIGPISLYASKVFGKVISWEPDYKAYNMFLKNIKNNNITNIELNRTGIYNKETTLSFGEGGTGRGSSTSSINCSNNSDLYSIRTTTIEKCLEKYGEPDFVKIDIEGAEEYIIDHLLEYKFKNILIETHFHQINKPKIFNEKIKELISFYDVTNKNGSINEIKVNDIFFMKKL